MPHRPPIQDHEFVERTDEHRIVRRRKDDIDRLARFNKLMGRYRIFWTPLLALAAGAGFGIVTPRQTAQQLQGQISGNMTAVSERLDKVEKRQDTLQENHIELHDDMKLLVRYVCLKTTNYERVALGLEGCIR